MSELIARRPEFDHSTYRKPFELIFQRAKRGNGWGGRIRTSTVCINSAASYRLDHAPVAASNILHQKDLVYGHALSLVRNHPGVSRKPRATKVLL